MKKKRFNIFMLVILTITSMILLFTSRINADEVTNYTNTVSITVDDQPITTDTKVVKGQSLTVTNNIAIPDSVTINTGDTMTLKLPSQLALRTTLEFDVNNLNGIKVGTAKTVPNTGTVTVTFTDQFKKQPLNKTMSLTFNVKLNNQLITKSGPVTFNYSGNDYTVTYISSNGVAIGDYEYKYGYQDTNDPSIIHWKILINARQDILRSPVITDTFGAGLTLASDIRAVRYSHVKGVNQVTESMLASMSAADKYIVVPTDTGFTITALQERGIDLDGALYIEYNTRIDNNAIIGSEYANTVTWSAKNFPTERTLTKTVRLETGTGSANSNNKPKQEEPVTPSSSDDTKPTTPSSSDDTKPTIPSSSEDTKPTIPPTSKSKMSISSTNKTKARATISNTTSKNVKKATKVLPRTGEQLGIGLMVTGVVLVTVAVTISYRRNKQK